MAGPPTVPTPAVGQLITATWGADVAADLSPQTWAALTPVNGFTASATQPPGYILDALGFVRLRGTIANTSGASIAVSTKILTMPPGLGPSFERYFVQSCTPGPIAIAVDPAGELSATTAIASGNSFQLDGMHWDLL